MPDNKRKITITARETIKNLNGKDCLLICVQLGNDYFKPRAIPYEVKLEEEHAFFVLPSDDYSTLYAFFPLRIPMKGKLHYGYADGEPLASIPFNFEKNKPELLDRKRVDANVVEVWGRKDLMRG
jgi:hypothetical protein